jgi:hypothetical protein
MLFRLLPYLAITLCIAGCGTPKVNLPEHPEVARAREEVARIQELEDSARARFREKYKQYACSLDDVPKTQEASGPGEKFKSMQFGDHVVLKLMLGRAIHADGSPYGPTRTESRYQLNWDNERVAEAESLFSLPLADDQRSHSRFFYNPADHTVVVFDDPCADIQRFCVFERAVKSGGAGEWTVKYFWVPHEPSSQPFPDMARILGVGGGKIYVEVEANGQTYALPFKDFLVHKLEFTVG